MNSADSTASTISRTTAGTCMVLETTCNKRWMQVSCMHSSVSWPCLLLDVACPPSSCSFASYFSNLWSETQANMQSKSNQPAHGCPKLILPNIQPNGFLDSEFVAIAFSFETQPNGLLIDAASKIKQIRTASNLIICYSIPDLKIFALLQALFLGGKENILS